MAGVALGPSGKWIEGIDPNGSVADAASRSLEARLAPVIHHLPLAAYHAGQDTEHVHRLRVSTRRAMAALKLYRDWLPRKTAKWVKKRLKKIRRVAGNARDLDVLSQRLINEYGERAGPIVAKIGEARAGVQPDIVSLAERMRRDDSFVRKTARLLDGIRPPGSDRDSATEAPFRDWARDQLASMVEEFFSAQPPADAEMAALHQFRIRAKALRYAIELLACAFDKELRKSPYRTIEQLQERLGAINDHVTARDQLRDWSNETENAAERASYCEIAESEMARLIEELGHFREWWTPERWEALSASRISKAGVRDASIDHGSLAN